MSQHRYHFVYQPLQHFVERLSTRGQFLLGVAKIIVVISLVGLAISRSGVI